MSMLSNLDLIRRVPLFAMLTPAQAESLAGAVAKRRFKRGEFLVEQGKNCESLFIILAGRARVVVTDRRDLKHGSFWQIPYSHTAKKSKCPKCAIENDRLSKNDFINKSILVHGDKYNYDKVAYVDNTSMVTITCKKHGDWIQRAASHLAGNCCRICKIEERTHSTKQFIEKAKIVHGNKYNYSKVDYKGNKIPVEILCDIHGSFWQRPDQHLHVMCGCRLCNESKGEVIVEIILNKYNLNYIREYKVLPYQYRYDFYLPELNIFIEFNGLQHYSPVEFFGGEESFHKTKERDTIKKQIVKANNGNLVIITYLHLNENTVERQLISSLKRIYKYWFLVDGKLLVFKGPLDVCSVFKLPSSVLIKDIVTEVCKKFVSCKVLF